MKQIRHIALAAILTIGCFGAVLYTSGCKNKCGSTTCSNGGTCVNNVCECPSGYYGNGCQNAWSTPYIGTYNCRQTCFPSVGNSTWVSSITTAATNGGYTVYISNFGNSSFLSVYATVDSVNTTTNIGSIYIPSAIDSGLSGQGKIYVATHDSIALTYSAYSSVGGISGFTCNMIMIKE